MTSWIISEIALITSCLQESIFTTPTTAESFGQIIYEAVMCDFMTQLGGGGAKFWYASAPMRRSTETVGGRMEREGIMNGWQSSVKRTNELTFSFMLCECGP